MAARAALAACSLALIAFSLTSPPLRAAECGAREDAERASHRALRWEDFQNPLPSDPSRRSAIQEKTEIEIRVSVRVDELLVATAPLASGAVVAWSAAVCVRAYLVKRFSGRNDKELSHQPRTRRLALEHEQGHFDLTQAHALRLQGRLAALTAEAENAEAAEHALRGMARAAYADAMRALAAEQARYDRATTHGNHRVRQAKWSRELATRLARPQHAMLEAAVALRGAE